MHGLERLRKLRLFLFKLKYLYYVKVWRMDIHPTAHFSLSTKFDVTHPCGVHIGKESYVCNGVTILAHDMTRNLFTDTYIGERCFIGVDAVILPGIRVGDECIVAAGSVVTKDVPPRSIVGGNPAQIIRSDIKVGPYGCFVDAYHQAIPEKDSNVTQLRKTQIAR